MTRTCPCGKTFEVWGKGSTRKRCDACVHQRKLAGGRKGVKRQAEKRGKAMLPCATCGKEFPHSPRGAYVCPECRIAARPASSAAQWSGEDGGVYMPSQEQIRADCLKLQETWTEQDFIRRAGSGRSLPVDMIEVPIRELTT